MAEQEKADLNGRYCADCRIRKDVLSWIMKDC